MNVIMQPSIPYPEALHDWGHIFTRALLRSDAGNADAIRSFEITPETLAAYCGLGTEHAAGAERAFKQALIEDPTLFGCLQHGTIEKITSDIPSCIPILMLTLLVDSLLDGEYEENGQYRTKLSQWLGVNRAFMDLRGIAIMWRALVSWLDAKVEAGEPFRRLILPTIPLSWTHIGYTRCLSFPTKRDLNFLRKYLDRNSSLKDDPPALVSGFDSVAHPPAVSFGLEYAFREFKTAFRSGAASIDHRFWRLVLRAQKKAGQNDIPNAELKMEFDEDGKRSYRLSSAESSEFSIQLDVSDAVRSPILLESPNLGPAIRRGIIFFRSSGLASWSAVGEYPLGTGPFHLAVVDRHVVRASGGSSIFSRSGTWHVSKEPISSATLREIARRLEIHTEKSTVQSIGLVDGIRVGKAWLGQPRYLPRLDGVTGDVEIRAVGSDETSMLTYADGQLSSTAPVEGEFGFGDKEAHWSRRAHFVSIAEIHANFEGANYSHPKLEEWQPSGPHVVDAAAAIDIHWDSNAYEFQDALEALYASSKSGISEGEAIAIVGRATMKRSWEMLRTLQEATFFDVRLRQQWRGRCFTLQRPTLTKVEIGAESGIVVSGALPSRLEADFRETIRLQGGQAFRRLSHDSLAPPLIGAVQIDANRVSEALGWKIISAPTSLDGFAATRMCESRIIGENYQIASAWDWVAGRFRTGTKCEGPISLVRLVHPGGRDHDIYKVRGKSDRTYFSRHAAIVSAFVQSKRPLFRCIDGILQRIAAEGALPIEISRALRLRSLINSGGTVHGWQYSISSFDEKLLSNLLPGLVDGAKLLPDKNSQMNYRRGRGARRPAWKNGEITT